MCGILVGGGTLYEWKTGRFRGKQHDRWSVYMAIVYVDDIGCYQCFE